MKATVKVRESNREDDQVTLSESPNRKAWTDFCGTVCAPCSRSKEKNQSFCMSCYFRLPPNMRSALYRRFGSGYEEAYQKAQDWLRDN